MNVGELMEKKMLLLENVDFELSTNGMVTEKVDHQDKPDAQTKDN